MERERKNAVNEHQEADSPPNTDQASYAVIMRACGERNILKNKRGEKLFHSQVDTRQEQGAETLQHDSKTAKYSTVGMREATVENNENVPQDESKSEKDALSFFQVLVEPSKSLPQSRSCISVFNDARSHKYQESLENEDQEDEEYVPERDSYGTEEREKQFEFIKKVSPKKNFVETFNQPFFGLKIGKDKIKLDKVFINGKYWWEIDFKRISFLNSPNTFHRYSVIQVWRQFEEKVGLEEEKKTLLRNAFQNDSLKGRSDLLLRLVTRSLLCSLPNHFHLLSPNKFTSFISEEELRNGPYFTFLSNFVDFGHHQVIGEAFVALFSVEEEGYLLFPTNQTHTQSSSDPNYNSFAVSNSTCPAYQFSSRPSFYTNQTNLLSSFQTSPLQLPNYLSPLSLPQRTNQFSDSFNTMGNQPISNQNTKMSISSLLSDTPALKTETPSSDLIIIAENNLSNLLRDDRGELSRRKKEEQKRGAKRSDSCVSKKAKVIDIASDPSDVPIVYFKETGTLYLCEVDGHKFSFITHIDLKRFIAEQVEVKKSLINSALQIVENTLCADSAKFDPNEYSSFFSFPKNCNLMRIFFLLDGNKIGKKVVVKRDEERKRWLIFLTKKYKHFEKIPCVVINDFQLKEKTYSGPKDRIKEMLFKMGFSVSLETAAPNAILSNISSRSSLVEIRGLLFHLNGFVMQDHCDSNEPHQLVIKGEGFRRMGITSLSVFVSPSPILCSKDWNRKNRKIYAFHTELGPLHMIDSETLLEFLPYQNREILHKVILNNPDFTPPFPEDQIHAQMKSFLLVDFLHIEGVFEIRRMEDQDFVWHLFIASEQKCVILDCTAFVHVFLPQVDPSLLHFHHQTLQMGKKLKVSNSHEPPNYATQLEIDQVNISDTTIPGIMLPELKEGYHIIWLTVFMGGLLLECVSKSFFVGNPTL